MAVSTPLPSGSRMSIKTMSGFVVVASASASRAVVAIPTTSSKGSRFNRAANDSARIR